MDHQILAEHKSKTVTADKAYVENWRGDLFVMIKEYYESSGETESTPGAMLLDMIENIGKENYLLVVHEAHGTPAGFLIGKIVGQAARVLVGFLGKGLDNKPVIKAAMDIFDTWAKSRGCTTGAIYTHRHPKSYKTLEKEGWKHKYTVYQKEYTV